MWKTGRERERVFKKLRLELESKTFETEVRAWVCNDHKEEKKEQVIESTGGGDDQSQDQSSASYCRRCSCW